MSRRPSEKLFDHFLQFHGTISERNALLIISKRETETERRKNISRDEIEDNQLKEKVNKINRRYNWTDITSSRSSINNNNNNNNNNEETSADSIVPVIGSRCSAAPEVNDAGRRCSKRRRQPGGRPAPPTARVDGSTGRPRYPGRLPCRCRLRCRLRCRRCPCPIDRRRSNPKTRPIRRLHKSNSRERGKLIQFVHYIASAPSLPKDAWESGYQKNLGRNFIQ